MTGHELAIKLMSMPDLPVIGFSVGQRGNENQSEPLTHVILGGREHEAWKKNNWGCDEGEIGLYFNYEDP